MPTLFSRVFMNGNSQAVRIPQEFRLNATRVKISRNEQGELVIRPVTEDRGAALVAALQAFDDDFAAVLEDDRRAQPLMQDRESL